MYFVLYGSRRIDHGKTLKIRLILPLFTWKLDLIFPHFDIVCLIPNDIWNLPPWGHHKENTTACHSAWTWNIIEWNCLLAYFYLNFLWCTVIWSIWNPPQMLTFWYIIFDANSRQIQHWKELCKHIEIMEIPSLMNGLLVHLRTSSKPEEPQALKPIWHAGEAWYLLYNKQRVPAPLLHSFLGIILNSLVWLSYY